MVYKKLHKQQTCQFVLHKYKQYQELDIAGLDKIRILGGGGGFSCREIVTQVT